MEGCDKNLDSRSGLYRRDVFQDLNLRIWLFGIIQFKEENKADLKMWLLDPSSKRILLFSDSHGCNQGVYHYPNVDLIKGIDDTGDFADNNGVNLLMTFYEMSVNANQGDIGYKRNVNIEALNSAIGWYGGINFKLRNLHVDLETDKLLTTEVGGGELYFFREPVRKYFQGDQYWYAEKDEYGLPSRVWGKEEGGTYKVNPLVHD